MGPDDDRSSRSPAVGLTLGLGLLGLLTALNAGAFAISLFLSLSALAAFPMALADRPGASSVRFALLGAGSAALALALVLVPLLTSDASRAARNEDPPRVAEQPQDPRPAPARSTAPSPAGG